MMQMQQNCKASNQKCEKLIFEEILPDLAQNTKMAISQPSVDQDQNPLGVKSYLVIGIHQCHSHPIPRFCQFSLFLQWFTNRHLMNVKPLKINLRLFYDDLLYFEFILWTRWIDISLALIKREVLSDKQTVSPPF